MTSRVAWSGRVENVSKGDRPTGELCAGAGAIIPFGSIRAIKDWESRVVTAMRENRQFQRFALDGKDRGWTKVGQQIAMVIPLEYCSEQTSLCEN
jgi:hypothetical protein